MKIKNVVTLFTFLATTLVVILFVLGSLFISPGEKNDDINSSSDLDSSGNELYSIELEDSKREARPFIIWDKNDIFKKYCEEIGYIYSEMGCRPTNVVNYLTFKNQEQDYSIKYSDLWMQKRIDSLPESLVSSNLNLVRKGDSCLISIGKRRSPDIATSTGFNSHSCYNNYKDTYDNLSGELEGKAKISIGSSLFPITYVGSKTDQGGCNGGSFDVPSKEIVVNNFPNKEANNSISLISTKDGEMLSQACVAEFFSLLSLGIDLDKQSQYVIDEKSTGSIYLSKFVDSFNDDSSDLGQTNIIFKTREGGEFVLGKVNTGDDLEEASLQVYGNDLIYLDKEGQIAKYDLLSKSSSAVTFSENIDLSNIVLEYYIDSGSLYALVGEATCNEYMGSCEGVELYQYDLSKEKSKLIANDVTKRSIIGLDKSSNEIYLAYMDGDGGESRGSFDVYNLDTGVSTPLRKDVRNEELSKFYEELLERLRKPVFVANQIPVYMGKITHPDNIPTNEKWLVPGESIRPILLHKI